VCVGLTSRVSGRLTPDQKKHVTVHFRECSLSKMVTDPDILSPSAEQPVNDHFFNCVLEAAVAIPNDQGESQQRAVVVLINDLSSDSTRPKSEGATRSSGIYVFIQTVGVIFHVQLLTRIKPLYPSNTDDGAAANIMLL